ncbi:MAG: ethylbenzene dehydrogenase-related protein [Pirellulaceae bacterium]
MNHRIQYIYIAVFLAAHAAIGCRQQTPVPVPEVIVAQAATVPADPTDGAWKTAPEYIAKLILQDLVEPRLMTPSTTEVRVRAISDGKELALRLAWADATPNDLPGSNRFCDACAIQLPAQTQPTVPAPQMGEIGRAVEITYWNAAWQAIVNGRGDTIQDIYPRAHADYYPFDSRPLDSDPDAQHAMELRYAPARALHNMMAGPRDTPVQELIAEGPGTITPVTDSAAAGHGQHTPDGWTVVLKRRLPAGISTEIGTQIAFAVWEGSQDEVASRKMRTGWIPMTLQAKP